MQKIFPIQQRTHFSSSLKSFFGNLKEKEVKAKTAHQLQQNAPSIESTFHRKNERELNSNSDTRALPIQQHRITHSKDSTHYKVDENLLACKKLAHSDISSHQSSNDHDIKSSQAKLTNDVEDFDFSWLFDTLPSTATYSSPLLKKFDHIVTCIDEKCALLEQLDQAKHKSAPHDLQHCKAALQAIPIKLQREQIIFGSTPIPEERAADIVRKQIIEAEKELRQFSRHTENLLNGEIVNHTYYQESKQIASNIKKDFQELVKEIDNSLKNSTRPDSNSNAASSYISDLTEIIRQETDVLEKDRDYFQTIASALKASSFSTDTEIKSKLDQLDTSMNRLTQKMSLAQLNAHLEFNKDAKLGIKEKSELSLAHGYLAGYRQAVKIENQLNALATKIVSSKANASVQLSNRLRDYAMLFHAQGKKYQAQGITHNLNAHAVFMAEHRLNIFDSSALVGTSVSSPNTYDVKIGGGGSVGNQLAKISLNLVVKPSTKYTDTINKDGHQNFSHKTTRMVGSQIGGGASIFGATLSAASTAQKSTSSSIYHAKSPDDIARHHAIASNNHRLLPDEVLLNKKLQKFYASFVNGKNIVSDLFGFHAQDPHLYLCATTQALENAIGSEVIIKQVLDKLSIAAPYEDSRFELNNVDPISTEERVASKAGTVVPQKNPIKVNTVDASIDFDISTRGLPIHNTSYGQIVPRFNLNLSKNATLTNTLVNGSALKPTHELISLGYTHNHDTSLQAIKNIQERVWQAKSTAQLPAHLAATHSLIAQEPLTPKASLQQSLAALEKLEKDFDDFEKIVPLFVLLAQDNIDLNTPYYKNLYNTAIEKINAYQLDGDKVLKAIPDNSAIPINSSEMSNLSRYEAAKESVGRIWDTFSSALGMLEFTALQSMSKNHTDISASLKEITDEFSQRYSAFAEKLAKPNLPLCLDTLYRYAALESPKVNEAESTTHNLELSLSANQPLEISANTTKPFSIGGKLSYTKNIPKQKPNPFLMSPSLSITFTGSLDGFLNTSKVNDKLQQHLEKIISMNANHFPSSTHDYLTAFSTVASTLANQAHLSTQPNHVQQDILKNSVLGREKMRQISVTVNATPDGISSATAHLITQKTQKFSTPNFGKYIAPGFVLAANHSHTESEKKVKINMQGSAWLANIESFSCDEFERYDIDSDVLEQIKLCSKKNDVEGLKVLFEKFFKAVQTNEAVLNQFFGLNALGGILGQFSSSQTVDNSIDPNNRPELKNSNPFHPKIISLYLEKKSTEAGSAKKISTYNAINQENFFEQTGASPDLVKARLDMPLRKQQGKTVAQFLATASARERADFFSSTKIGTQLFANYLLTLKTAADVISMFSEVNLQTSSFAMQRRIPTALVV